MAPSALSGAEIRSRFLRFFEERQHRIVPSSSLVPENDPTLLFVNAGMVQFKRLFLGEETRDYLRATTSQKCMRVSGKHNDLENVGRTTRHLTFFEMLGNFSFGDYFKRDAIRFAWEFVTEELGLPADRLVVSVFREDDDAFDLWRDDIGLPEERIFRLDEDENFWSMGDTGPCGPCSEIHWDHRPEEGYDGSDDPSSETGRFVEIWNLVFMQYNRDASGHMEPLPKPSVDTGAGLERVTSVVQGVTWVYDTDLFAPILARGAELAGITYGDDDEKDVSLRVVADHARSCTFMVADGVLPSNEGRGYVLRRILRRAARHGVLLGLQEPFLYRVADAVIDAMAEAYPALSERRAYIVDRIRREEERFLETLSKGLTLLEEEIDAVAARGGDTLAGDVAFRLYDTFGFPLDLTEDILSGRKLQVDRAGFDTAMERQRARARAAWKGSGAETVDARYAELAAEVESDFTGYASLESSSRVLGLLVNGAPAREAKAGDEVEVVVETTPFYAESGGQVGDRGVIRTANGRVDVIDTQRPAGALIVHRGKVAEGEIHLDDTVVLAVDPEARGGAVRHHSGTHLLHAALREVLGPAAVQRGSLVAPNRLRFDFSHDGPVTPDELERIEDLVNGWVGENAPAHVDQMPYDDAIAAGAVAMFGEKYGDEVRVVSFGDFSKELCGGTHARASGEIGPLKIVSESGVAAGVRRLEAVTGAEALVTWRGESRELARSAALLRAPAGEVADRIERLLDERRALEKQIENLQATQRAAASGDLLSTAREVGDVRVLATRVEGVKGKALRNMVDELRQKLGTGVVLLAAVEDGRVALALGVTQDLVGRFKAGALIGEVAQVVGGKGGGRPDFAQAGGDQPEQVDAAFERLFALVGEG